MSASRGHGPGRYGRRGLPRASSPAGIKERAERRLKFAPEGEEFRKPGSRNPRKAGR